MAKALVLARKGIYTSDPNPRVGCVIVKNHKIIGQGYHRKTGENHAEINALEQAGDNARGAVVYVSLEPCSHHGKTPPCVEALVAAGVKKVIVAMEDPNPLVSGRGIAKLKAAGIEVISGILEREAIELNPGFIKRMQESKPFIRIKLAMSLDGKTAMASGESKWITSAAARLDGQKLRARSSAILTGAGTVLADNPSLNVRDLDIGRQPLRIILDTELEVSSRAKIFKLPGEVVVVTIANNKSKIKELEAAGAEVFILPKSNSKVNWSYLMTWLGKKEINELHVEAGATLAGTLLQEGLVDEVVIYMAGKIMGDQARSLFNMKVDIMSEAVKLKFTDIRMLGEDVRITAVPTV